MNCILFLCWFFFLGGGGENVKRKVCILQCFCTIFGSKGQGQHAQICILNFASLPHTKCSLTIIFDIQWCNFTYKAMFSMTSGVPLLTMELKDPRYIVKLEVKMLDITFHLNIMILHKYMLSMTWEWFQQILGSKTQTKENMKSLIFFTTGRGDLSHKYSSSFIFWKLLKFQLYLKLIIMHLVVVLVMSDSFVYRMHLQYALILNKFCWAFTSDFSRIM